MEKVYDPKLQQRLEELIEKLGGKNGGQTKASQLIGYSTGTLSTYRNSKYVGDVKKLEKTLREFFKNRDDSEAMRVIPKYVPTTTSEQVYTTIRQCHLMGAFTVECGDAGIGKTMAAKKYAADYPDSSIYVSLNPCFATLTAFLRLLCRKLALDTGTKDIMWQNIFDHLKGGVTVLIIDEAQHLPIKTIDSIRGFFDDLREEGEVVGIVLVGNPTTITKRSGPQKKQYEQVDNRTLWTGIRKFTDTTREDIQLLFPALAGQDKEIDLLHVIAQTRAGVRGAVNLYKNAARNHNTDYAGLLAMAKAMNMMIF